MSDSSYAIVKSNLLWQMTSRYGSVSSRHDEPVAIAVKHRLSIPGLTMSTKQESRRNSGRSSAPRSRRGAESSAFGASIDVVDFAVARAAELKALRTVASSVNGNRRVYQQLSWHARRRTMSHSSRRMPVRLRAAHAAQLQKQRPPGQPEKPPGPRGAARLRKYRKKARFLDSIRKLRAKNPAWLETHVWHAKRFSMAVLGGKRVAIKCNDRGYRSCYRATAHASVVHDASYLAIVEVCSTSKDVLKAVLKRRMSFEDGRRATTDPVTSGTRRVTDLVVQDESGVAIAPVDILWRPGPAAQFWIWVLPAMQESVEDAFAKTFSGEVENVCKVSQLANTPLRFSLFGPRSGIVLASVLEPSRHCPDGLKFITQVRSAACLPASCVYSGCVPDPRRAFPPKTMDKHNKNVKVFGDKIREAFRYVEDSELWDEERRKYWREYVPSDVNESSKSKSKAVEVPFLLLQACNSESRGFASGWDLLVPAGWAMAFWASLMFSNGNRAIGQDELRLLRLEATLPVFPEDFVDTVSGSAALREEEKEVMAAYLRRPKSKRVNYTLNRIKSPMYPALTSIAEGEMARAKQEQAEAPPLKKPRSEGDISVEGLKFTDDGDIRIIRSQQQLQKRLGAVYRTLFPSIRRPSSRRPRASPIANTQPAPFDDDVLGNCYMFARVTLHVPGRGVPTKNAIICAATSLDLAAMRRTDGEMYGGFREDKARRGDSAPAREVIGYVTVGAFSLTRGAGIANGVVAVNAIRRLVEEGAVISPERGSNRATGGIAVLFRNVSSLQYRPAVIQLLI